MNKKLSSLLGGNKSSQKKSEHLENRESWLKVIVIGAFALLLFYKIATSPFVFRFSDFISLFASLFAVAVSLMYYKKYNELSRKFDEMIAATEKHRTPSVHVIPETVDAKAEKNMVEDRELVDEGNELPVEDQLAEDVQEEQAHEKEALKKTHEAEELLDEPNVASVIVEEPLKQNDLSVNQADEKHVSKDSEKEFHDDVKLDTPIYHEPTEEEMKTQKIKEEELKQLEMDKTQIYNTLYTRSDLNEEERKYFQQQLQEKETQASNLKKELIQFTNRISQAINKTPQLFQKRDSRIEGIVRLLTPEFVSQASLSEINARLDELTVEIPEETLDSLQREGYLDGENHFTRSGYREAINTSKLI